MPNEVKIVVKGENRARQPMQAALSDVNKLRTAVDKLPEKKEIKVTVTGGDAAEKAVDKVDKKEVKDKETKVTAKDEASDTIEKVSNTKPKAVTVPVKADSDKVAGAFGDAGKQGASAFIGGFTGGLAGGGLMDAASSLIGDVFARAGEKQHLQADIGNMMGVTPEAAKQYGDRIGSMFWGGIGDSKDQIAGAFGSLSSDVRNWGNLTTEQQDRVVKKAVAIGSAFKVDVQEPIRAASSMVDNKLVPSFDDAFDVITKSYQTLGSRSDDALDTLQEYAGYFEMLGMTGNQALGVIRQGLQGGARDTDFIADAFKEFGILAIENTDSAKQAIKDLGMNAKTTQKALRDGGPAAAEATQTIIEKLKQVKDEAKRNEIGKALFGTKWEDTMRQVIGSIDLGKAKMEEFKGATDGLATGAITETEKLSRAWDKFTADFGEDVATVINHQEDFMDSQNDAIGSLFDFGSEAEATARKGTALGEVVGEVMRKKFENLAASVGGVTTPAFASMMMKMSETELKAMGVSRQINDLGQTVVRLPDGKHIVVDANDQATAVIQSVANRFYRAVIHVDTIFRQTPNGAVLNSKSAWGNAAGGAVVGHAAEGGARSGFTRVNEQGTELGRTQRGDLVDMIGGMTVVPAGQTAAIQAAAGGGQMGGGGVGMPIQINLMLDRRTLQTVNFDLMRESISNRGGNVQSALGRG